MAEKVFRKFFEEFRGLNLRASDLTRPVNFAKEFYNFELLRTGSARGRKGHKIFANQRAIEATDYSPPAFGLQKHTYTDKTTGETKQELIGFGNWPHRLVPGTLTIAYGGAGATATFSFFGGGQGQDFVADLKVDNVTVGGIFPKDYGTGKEATPPTLATLAADINSIAGFTATLTPNAVVNGNQANRSLSAPITVDAGHTFTISTSVPTRAGIFNRNISAFYSHDIVAQTATTLTPRVDSLIQLDVNDNDIIGVGNYPAAILPITDSLSVKPSAVITFYFWETIQCPNSVANLLMNTGAVGYPLSGPDGHNYQAKNNSNNLYFGLGHARGFLHDGVTETGLLKYDGQYCYNAGLIEPAGGGTTVLAAGAGLSVGRYRYKYRYKQIDHRGNITYSAEMDLPEVTTAGGNLQVTISARYLSNFYTFLEGWNAIGAVITAVAASNVIPIVAPVLNSYSFRVGDTAALIDTTAGSLTLTRRKVTAVSNTSFTIDGAPITNPVAGFLQSIASNNLTVELYRTKVGGTKYYLVQEFANHYFTTNFTYTDSTPDASLGIEWDGPFLGNRRRDMPPVIHLLENHQGILVGAGDPKNPETLYWSNDDGPEYWPRGTNNIDVTSTEVGPITSIFSDNIDNFAIFKDSSHYNLSGDLVLNNISISSSSEGDVGCPSPFGAIKIRDYLYFISNKGPRIVRNGVISEFSDLLIPVFEKNFYTQVNGVPINFEQSSKLVVRRTISVADVENQKAYFYIPAEKGTPGISNSLYAGDQESRLFVFDWANNIWAEYGFTNQDNMIGGAAFYNNEVYWLARTEAASADVRGFLFKQSNTGTRFDYMDNEWAIDHWFRPQWDLAEEPSVNKEFIRLKVYSMFPDGEVFTPFFLDIKTYKNFFVTGTPDSQHFATTMTFDAVTKIELEVKLRTDKMRAIMFDFRSPDAFSSPLITGYEYVIALPYKKDDISQ